jgi:protein TonB
LNTQLNPSVPRRQSAGFLHWEDPGEPITVYFHLNSVELLERDAIRVGKAMTAGILLGKRDDTQHLTLVVENYEPVPVPTWKSSDSPFGDRRLLNAMRDRWRSRTDKRMSVLGFYRSCAEGESTLSEDDLSVLRSDVGAAISIFLLIEPGSGRVSNGHLFMAKDGAVSWEWNEAPFSRGQLSGRETALPSAVRQSSTAVQDEPTATHDTEESQTIESFPQPGFEISKRWLLVLGAAAMILLLMSGYHQLRRKQPPDASVSKAEQSSDSNLGLKLDRTGTDWKLSWATDSPLVTRATGAQLLITDGALRKTIKLDASDLRGGTIVYSPLTDDVVLRFQVDTPDSSEPASETVRIVGGLPSAGEAPLVDLPARDESSRAGLPRSVPPPLSEDALENMAKQSAGSVALRTGHKLSQLAGATPRTGIRDSGAQSRFQHYKLPEDVLTVKEKPISSSATRAAIAANRKGPATSSTPAFPISSAKAHVESIPVIPAASLQTNPSDSGTRHVSKGGAIQPAQLLTNMSPAYPPAARQNGISGSVELHFRIGTAGDVRDIRVVTGPPVLAEAAVEAVLARKYKPALVDGVPTETDASATFDFKLN